MFEDDRKIDKCLKAERSLITTYRAGIWKKFVNAVNEYELIKDGDSIAVCISGGKDSMMLAKLMQELFRHGKQNFSLKFIVMDPGYNEKNRKLIEHNLELLKIPAEIFSSEIFSVVTEVGGSPCYLCARMRRGYLYSKAKDLGCNKIALGHHFDDVIETILMGVLYNGKIKTMMPKLHSLNFKGMELIRPLYQVKEKDIINWANYNELEFLRCACRFTELSNDNHEESKRLETKLLIKELVKKNPSADINIFKSVYNVDLRNIIGFKKDDYRYHFLSDYDSYANDEE